MIDVEKEFSFRSREKNIRSFKTKKYDLLIIGGGITGAAVAHKASLLGLSVALVEKNDFASGTSSASSKLIHGGLRYLENLELGLVFEALKERDYLLQNAPHMVRPLKFVLPVYKNQKVGRFKLSMGMWLYDLLSLFRAPGFHENLSARKLMEELPDLNKKDLKGGFRYWDASMWDDMMVVETLRAAQAHGAHCVSYCEAITPYWEEGVIQGFYVQDKEAKPSEEFLIQAENVICCVGPWTDLLGPKLESQWKNWLKPSQGVHLVFDHKKIPVKDAVVMPHSEDGRIVFVIPRLDFGAGVTIVGTTDSPSPKDPEDVKVESQDITYILGLLKDFFPDLNLTQEDIVSTYIGVRPLVSPDIFKSDQSTSLQKMSREHFIGNGPGGTVLVAGGKYTTHRAMADEILKFALHKSDKYKTYLKNKIPAELLVINKKALKKAVAAAQVVAQEKGYQIPSSLWDRYGSEALDIYQFYIEDKTSLNIERVEDPVGFDLIKEQLKFHVRTGMTLHLKDFYFRRVPLFLALKDHGLSLAPYLAQVLAEERAFSKEWAEQELELLKTEIKKRT